MNTSIPTKIWEYFNSEFVVRQLYELLIILSGAYVINSFVHERYNTPANFYIIIIWLALIIALPTPEVIKAPISPFRYTDSN